MDRTEHDADRVGAPLGSRSIQRKLRSLFMFISTIVLLLATVGFLTADVVGSRHEVVTSLSALGDVVGLNSSAALLFSDADAAREALGALRAKPSVLAAAVYTSEGNPFALYQKSGVAPTIPGRPMITGEHGLIEVIREIRLDNELVGSVYLASDTRQSTDRVKRFLMVAVAILLLSLGVAFGLASRLQLVISDPIVQLGGVAQQVRLQKSYSVRVAVPAATRLDEIGQLTLAFNDMLAEIERRDHDLQRHRDDLEQQVEQRTADLAAAKDAAERIADQNAQLSRHKQMILNGAGDGIFGLDEDGIATFINPSAATMLGWTVEELIGRPLHSILHPPEVQRSAAGCNVCSALLRPSTRTGRAESFRRRDGSSFPVEYTASIVIDPSGKASGVVVTFRDVTEKRAVERMKDEFVSTVSHELRTPLTSIRGALGLLSSGLLGGIEARGKRMLEIAVTNTDRLVRLINDILDLERMESGRVELTRRPAAVGDLMVEAVQTVQAVADDARVKIEFEPLDTVVSVDRDRVVQTLTNLLGNAVKFSSEDATVHMGASVADHRLTIWVRDEGRGIPSEKQGTIFERFKQVDASDSREKGGSGLGLAICRSIVNAHGGRIWCESVEGKGSVFTFALPLDAGDAHAIPNESAPVKTILVCPQEGPGSTQVSRTLEEHGFRVVIVSSPKELLGTACEIDPQAIVLDVEPTCDWSWAFSEGLKAHATLRRVPIIIVSAQAPAVPDELADLVIRWIPRNGDPESLVQAVNGTTEELTVLLVEDDTDLARVMMALLQPRGIHALHATNGREAIEICRTHAPRLVVLDLVLPELDGFAVVEWMRLNSTFEKTPLLVFSAQEIGSADQRRLRLGPSEFLTKSRVSLDFVTNRVAALLRTATDSTEVASVA